MVYICKMIIFLDVFLIFSKVWLVSLFGGEGGAGKKGKKWSKITKKSVCCAFYFRNHISYGLHLWYTCMYKRIISQGFFFISSKFWLSGSLGWAKGQKVAQNDKIFCLSHSASQEPYIIWLWFLVHMSKIFFIFSEFWFLRFLGG